MKTITLLTDFGLKDPYAGIMKGVILSINPDARIVDITHEVEAQDIREAAFMIGDYYPWFRDGAIHVAVVDPTVGGARKSIIVTRDRHLFVGPDNGIFSLVMDETAKVHAIDRPDLMLPEVSATFHGRDIFAPAAAHLSTGETPQAFGPCVPDPVRLSGLIPVVEDDTLLGEIVRFDRFGNGITNISRDWLGPFLAGTFRIEVGTLCFDRLYRSYFESDVVCLIGSSGYLEFGYFMESFMDMQALRKGALVRVRRL